MAQPVLDATGVPTSHPKGFWFIFTGELAERASFYGMRGLLVMYLIHCFNYTRADASDLMHTYMAACYFTPLLGAWIADRYLGKYWTIVAFSVPYVIGQFIVGLSDKTLMYTALVLLALGSGVIKPNISTLMGMMYDQQRPGQTRLRSQAFSWFYVAINIGSFLSYNICPWLRDTFGKLVPDPNDPQKMIPSDPQTGYMVALMFPAVLMAVALACFALGKKYYAVEVIDRTPPSPAQRTQRWNVVGRVFGLFFVVMFFWAIFDQKTSTWIYFADDYLDLNVFGFRIAPDRIQSLNPIFIICFVPIVNRIYAMLERRGYDIRPTNKIMVGLIFTAIAVAIHAVIGYLAVNPDGTITRVSVAWQALAFVFLTLAEILISITGLELAFTAAPPSMKSFVTSLWLVTVGLANLLINKPVTQLFPSEKILEQLDPGETMPSVKFLKWKLFPLPRFMKFESAADYFLAMTMMMLTVAVAFYFVARRFNRAQAAQTAAD